MFTINKKTENGFDKFILKDESSGTFAAIIPSCGAILHAFIVIKDGKQFNVIDSYESAEDFKNNITKKGFLGCKLSPFVCRINKGEYHFAETDYKIKKYYDRNNALHGELYDQQFTITDESAGEQSATISMKYEYRGTDAGYPFNYDCIIIYQLVKDNKLNVQTEIINKDEGLIPIQDGWHPYFTLDDKIDDLQLEFKSNEILEFNDDLITTVKLTTYEEFGSLKK